MQKKLNKAIKTMFILFCVAMATGCSNSTPKPTPLVESDSTERILDDNANSIKAGLTYATERVGEWRSTMHLNFINAGFYGKEQIKERVGMISYFYYEDKVTDKLDADAEVMIDMSVNSIVLFNSSYGSAKKLGGGSKVLNIEKWTIDINEAFDLAIAEFGEGRIDQYEKPKVVLTCSESFWEFTVYPGYDARYPDITVKLDPVKGEVVNIRYREVKD